MISGVFRKLKPMDMRKIFYGYARGMQMKKVKNPCSRPLHHHFKLNFLLFPVLKLSRVKSKPKVHNFEKHPSTKTSTVEGDR